VRAELLHRAERVADPIDPLAVALDQLRPGGELGRRLLAHRRGLALERREEPPLPRVRGDLRREDLVPTLEPASFDLVWLQAVVEHLLPEERRAYLRQFWRALRPGGWLVVTETPNRVWPYETHTSGGRWLLPWMPAARIFATMRREERFAAYTDEAFYRSGIVGSTYGELLDCLGRPADCEEPARALRRYVARLYEGARVKTAARRAAVSALGLLEPAVRGLTRRPVMAFTPYLNHVAFRKAR